MAVGKGDHHKEGDAWVSASHIQYFLSLAEGFGFRVDDILATAGLNRAKLADTDGQVPVAALETVLTHLSEHFETPLIGLQLAGEVQPAVFGVLGFLTQSCATFGDVLDMVIRYNGLLSNIGHTSLDHSPGKIHIQWDCRAGGELFRRHATEYVLGSMTVLMRALLYGKSSLPLYVHLAHPAPSKPFLLAHYHALFQCPVHFGQAESKLVIPSQYRAEPMRHNNAFVREALENHARDLLKKRTRSDLKADVKDLVRVMMTDGIPSLDMVARQLGMSGRTLHRALQKEDGSYQQLLDEARMDQVQELLTNTSLSIEEVAARVGFQTRQSLIRWFKEKQGITPGDYRQQSSL
jgi:AraC-like DNA-binding protein